MPETIKYISKITLLDGTVVKVKDAEAREAIAGGTHFLGVTTSVVYDGASTNPIVIGGEDVTAVNGDIIVCGNKEFIYAATDSVWHELGDVSGLGALALKDSASGLYTPSGTVSKPDVDVTATTATIAEFASAGSVTAGAAASCTLPTFAATYDQTTENLALTWAAGSFIPNTPTQVTLPTSKNTSVVTGTTAALHETPIFTGTTAAITVE